MLVIVLIGIVVLGIYYSNLGGVSPSTIDPAKPDPVFIEKIVTGQSEPANRKPTPEPVQPVVKPTPADVGSNFSYNSDTY